MKKYLAALYFFTTLAIFSQSTSSTLVKKLEETLSDNFFTTTTTAIEIFNLSKEQLIYSKNSKLLLRPASNQKIITSLAALTFLDSNYTFNTSIHYDGIIKDSILQGDMYVIGGGDPEFTLKDMDSLVFNIHKYGIKSISGNLYGDISMFDSTYWGAGWMWDDNPYSFSPYLSPLILEKSACKIFYSPGEIGKPAQISVFPKSDFYQIKNTSVTISEDTSDFNVTRDWINDKNDIIVSGTISQKSKPDSVFRNISKPNLFFLTVLKEKMITSGISFNGLLDTLSLPENSSHIYTLKQPLDSVLFRMNKKSDNLNAEMVLRALGNKYFGERCSAEDGLKIIDSLVFRTGLNPENYCFTDGSGLSFYNLISAELIIEIMKNTYRKRPNLFKRFYNTLPIAGIDGTLKDRLRNPGIKNNLRAKTGTLSGVSCLSGILKSKKGDDILFSIMIQNYVKSARNARQLQDKICNLIYEEL